MAFDAVEHMQMRQTAKRLRGDLAFIASPARDRPAQLADNPTSDSPSTGAPRSSVRSSVRKSTEAMKQFKLVQPLHNSVNSHQLSLGSHMAAASRTLACSFPRWIPASAPLPQRETAIPDKFSTAGQYRSVWIAALDEEVSLQAAHVGRKLQQVKEKALQKGIRTPDRLEVYLRMAGVSFYHSCELQVFKPGDGTPDVKVKPKQVPWGAAESAPSLRMCCCGKRPPPGFSDSLGSRHGMQGCWYNHARATCITVWQQCWKHVNACSPSDRNITCLTLQSEGHRRCPMVHSMSLTTRNHGPELGGHVGRVSQPVCRASSSGLAKQRTMKAVKTSVPRPRSVTSCTSTAPWRRRTAT